MNPLALSRIAQACNGRLEGEDVVVDAVVTDSRGLRADAGAALFVAIAGDNFDGHDHVASAAAAGARAALVSRLVDVALPQVLVGDTVAALGSLAAALQAQRTAQVIAITGSNGKTSVKQLLVPILARCGRTYCNPGNRNNEIGLPLAVIDAPDDAEFAIYEMGAGQPGDIAYLTAIARPRVAMVNNVAPAHLERMGSLLGVADTKAAIYDALPDDGTAVLNADDAFEPYFAERAHGRRLLRFGFDARADVRARDVVLREDGSDFVLVAREGEIAVSLPLAGRHNVANALAAAALALACGAGLDAIAAGLASVQPVAGRLVRHRLASGAWLVDDSYNANPGSLAAAIDILAAAPGEGWLVLGDMRELGADAVALHEAAGRRARDAGVARLYAHGALSAVAAEAFGSGGEVFASHAELAGALAAALAASDGSAATQAAPTILVKGSRGSAMDRVVAALLTKDDTHAA